MALAPNTHAPKTHECGLVRSCFASQHNRTKFSEFSTNPLINVEAFLRSFFEPGLLNFSLKSLSKPTFLIKSRINGSVKGIRKAYTSVSLVNPASYRL